MLTVMVALIALSAQPLNQTQQMVGNDEASLGIFESAYARDEVERANMSENGFPYELLSEEVIISLHFIVQYSTTGPDSATHEYAQNVSNALEYSWDVVVGNFGFRSPPTFITNIYVKDLPPGTAGVAYSAPYIEIDNGLSPVGALNATCAHEFFHIVQLSYDWFEEEWIKEGTADWMASKVFPEYAVPTFPSYVHSVNSFMLDPDRSLTQLSYDAVLFWIFLDEHHGGIPTMKDVFEETVFNDGIYAVNATLNKQGKTFSRVFAEWTVANYLKDSYYANGALFDQINFTPLTYDGAASFRNGNVVDWGADYFEISSDIIYMPIEIIGEQSNNISRILIEHSQPIVHDLMLDATYTGYLELMQANNLDRITIVIRSLGTETSNNRVDYGLALLASSFTLEGSYYLASSTTTITTTGDREDSFSSSVIFAAAEAASAGVSSHSTITLVDDTSVQTSSSRTATVVSQSSSQNSSETVTSIRMEGDVNGDGTVNNIDLEALSRAYGSSPQSSNWNPSCDFNDDSKIDITDLNLLGKSYGRTIP
jgi:hypothetical protein